jgi:hypothetical protein
LVVWKIRKVASFRPTCWLASSTSNNVRVLLLGASSVIYAASIVVTILHHPLLCFDTVGRMLIQRPGNMWFFLSVILSSTALSAARAEDAVTFNRDIRPILADKCFACHGPDAATREADLRLDQEESAKRDREGHAAIQAGDPKHSELAVRIRSTDPDLMMPPPDSQRTLTDEEKQTLLGWIADGAKWEGHWSFIAPRRSALPEVSDARWPRNAIDHFVLRKLDDAGLQPSSETERTTWIRRASFDLTGLPPTTEEVDAFLADDGDVAFEAVIDRLLRSKHYGEQMAAAWLDAARYADTDGYQNDGPRTMFRYRDWVIDAFNGNMPFDQFTIEHLRAICCRRRRCRRRSRPALTAIIGITQKLVWYWKNSCWKTRSIASTRPARFGWG